ncbi:MAG TPA: NAD(P)H-dependent oxidoreductase [Planctomycetota bacterium]|nr:NAD(P)H-dependent oxidoreductase [Planctomycetota bacterium]
MKVLVVYYSRTGVTRKTSETLAETLRGTGHEVTVEEIREKGKRGGILGFFAMSFSAIFKRPGAIETVEAEVGSFDLVAIGTPVWAWSASAPVRTFCKEHGHAAGKLAFFATMGSSGDKGAFKAMTALCGKEPVATMSLIDKAVKKDDAEGFTAKVKTFAAAMTTEASG